MLESFLRTIFTAPKLELLYQFIGIGSNRDCKECIFTEFTKSLFRYSRD
jgi:hypothetical protein